MSTDTEKEELEARLAAAKARRAELERAREEREERRRLRAEVERAEAAEAEHAIEESIAKAIDDAEAQGERLDRTMKRIDVRYLDGTLVGAVLVRRAHPTHYSKFENKIGEAKGIENDHLRDELWRRCLIWPDVGKVEELIEKQPFTRSRLTDAICVLAGIRKEDIAGK